MICLSEVTLTIVREWITWLHIAFYDVGDDNNFTYQYYFMTIANDGVPMVRDYVIQSKAWPRDKHRTHSVSPSEMSPLGLKVTFISKQLLLLFYYCLS